MELELDWSSFSWSSNKTGACFLRLDWSLFSASLIRLELVFLELELD